MDLKREYVGMQEFAVHEEKKGWLATHGLTVNMTVYFRMWRTPVPGGWLVMTMHSAAITPASTTFYPDPTHEWAH